MGCCCLLCRSSLTLVVVICGVWFFGDPRLQAGLVDADAISLSKLPRSSARRTLTTLDLTRCIHLEGATLLALAKHAHKLQLLNVTLCSAVTDADLRAAVAANPALEVECPRRVSSDPAAASLVPGFKPPPPRQQFAARKFFSTVKSTAPGKKKKGKTGKR